jgi:hypothetical protein
MFAGGLPRSMVPMPQTPKDDETKFNETLKRMLSTPPQPHKSKPDALPEADEKLLKEMGNAAMKRRLKKPAGDT